MNTQEANDILCMLWGAAREGIIEGDFDLEQKVRAVHGSCLLAVAIEAIELDVNRLNFCHYFASMMGMRWLVVGNAFAKAWAMRKVQREQHPA